MMKDFSTTTITELAAIIAEHLTRQDIEVVLVGGLAVEIYSDNIYLTKDIDMVNTNYQPPHLLHSAMAELGFHKQGRIYTNKTTDITVEFPAGPLSVGDDLIKKTTIATIANRSIPILHITDVIKDRLAAFIHWRDNQALIQAVAVMLKHELKPTIFKKFCQKEGIEKHYQQLDVLHQSAKKHHSQSMDELEALLQEQLFKEI